MMSWTKMTDIHPPKDKEVIFLWDDGAKRIGELFGVDIEGKPLVKCVLDFGDTYTSIYPPKDYRPIAWTRLPDTQKQHAEAR